MITRSSRRLRPASRQPGRDVADGGAEPGVMAGLQRGDARFDGLGPIGSSKCLASCTKTRDALQRGKGMDGETVAAGVQAPGQRRQRLAFDVDDAAAVVAVAGNGAFGGRARCPEGSTPQGRGVRAVSGARPGRRPRRWQENRPARAPPVRCQARRRPGGQESRRGWDARPRTGGGRRECGRSARGSSRNGGVAGLASARDESTRAWAGR